MQRYSALRCLCAALCVMVIVAEVATAVPTYADYENSIRDLYELLLQKEALEDRLGAHQVTRKSNRTPSLRLRFGRRSDPNMLASPYLLAQESADHPDN
ncbi:putative regulation of response to extracellular stimulus [Trypoxylus dichotomus]